MLEETIERLIGLAKAEKWGDIDAEIPKVSRLPEIVKWAYKTGLFESNDQVRDLAASILEKADWSDNQRLIHGLVYNTLRQEPYIYAKFRLAFALYAHGEREPVVVAVVEEAAKDKDTQVKDIALKYLAQK